jgi:plasmid rolling circle replication initiator protein Rep
MQKSKAEWIKLWRDCMRLDYSPILDTRAVKEGNKPMQLVPELLKYVTKKSDLVAALPYEISNPY